MLTENNLPLNELDVLAVVVGPGSFTGIRVGIATAKGILSVFNNIKAVRVNSFELLAYNIIADNHFLALLDSGNQEPYFAEFADGKVMYMGSGKFQEIEEISRKKAIKIYAMEEEREKFKENDVHFVNIKNNSLISLVSGRVNEGSFVEINDLAPIYIKASQAEKQFSDSVFKDFEIRRLYDADEISDIEKECFKEEAYSLISLRQELEQADRYYFVAKHGGETVGYIGLWKTGDDLNMLKLAVAGKYRGIGIAGRLIERAVQLKEEQSLDKFFLEVNENNLPAIKLYEKMGFTAGHRRENYYKTGEACLVMFYKK